MHLSNSHSSQLKLHFVVLLWGFTAILGELISIDAIPLVAYRIAIALFVIFFYLKWKGFTTQTDSKLRWKLYGAGLIIALHWVTFFHAIKISSVSVTLACMGSGALFASILEPLFFKRKIALSEILLGLSVSVGILTIANAESAQLAGILVALLSAALSALFSVINGLMVKKCEPEVITIHELFGGWVFLILILILQMIFGTREFSSISISSMDLLWLLLLGIFATAYAFIQSVSVMKELSPFTVVLSINMEPVYGIILAFFIFGESERMSNEFYFGTLIILSSVLINGYLKSLRRRRSLKSS